MSETTDGRKVFFLYPQSVIQEELISFLLKNEYEVYFLKDHRKATRIFKRFNNSICFINIEEGLKEADWIEYIESLKSDPDINGLQLGILSYNNDPALMQKYLMDIGVECGFIQLKLGLFYLKLRGDLNTSAVRLRLILDPDMKSGEDNKY